MPALLKRSTQMKRMLLIAWSRKPTIETVRNFSSESISLKAEALWVKEAKVACQTRLTLSSKKGIVLWAHCQVATTLWTAPRRISMMDATLLRSLGSQPRPTCVSKAPTICTATASVSFNFQVAVKMSAIVIQSWSSHFCSSRPLTHWKIYKRGKT